MSNENEFWMDLWPTMRRAMDLRKMTDKEAQEAYSELGSEELTPSELSRLLGFANACVTFGQMQFSDAPQVSGLPRLRAVAWDFERSSGHRRTISKGPTCWADALEPIVFGTQVRARRFVPKAMCLGMSKPDSLPTAATSSTDPVRSDPAQFELHTLWKVTGFLFGPNAKEQVRWQRAVVTERSNETMSLRGILEDAVS